MEGWVGGVEGKKKKVRAGGEAKRGARIGGRVKRGAEVGAVGR